MQKCLSLFFMLSIIIRLGFSPFPCPVCCVCLVLNHRLIFLITEHVMIMKVNQETFDNWVGNSAEIQIGSFLGLKQLNSNTWVLLWIVSCSGALMWSMFVQRSVSRPKYKDQHERLRWWWVCRPPVVIWGLGRECVGLLWWSGVLVGTKTLIIWFRFLVFSHEPTHFLLSSTSY